MTPGSSTPSGSSTSSQNQGQLLTLPSGYAIQNVVTGLDFPTAIAFDGDMLWVTEAGIFGPDLPPKIKSINSDGIIDTILTSSNLPDGVLEGPLTDVTAYQGWLWITHRQRASVVADNACSVDWMVGAISRFRPEDPVGTFQTVITNLPSAGDHYAEEVVFDDQGRGYFSQGTATNSSIVGPDNQLITGWLKDAPTFHDFSPKAIQLAEAGYETPNILTDATNDIAVTAPYHAYNTGRVAEGTAVAAATPANPQEGIIAGNGAVYSFQVDEACMTSQSTLKLEGWGFRNPYGIGLDPMNKGRLLVTNNGADIRMAMVDGALQIVESRPIGNDWDDLFSVDLTNANEEFYGWPDYFHDPDTLNPLPVTDPKIWRPEYDAGVTVPPPKFVMSDAYRSTLHVENAVAEFEEHVSANKFDVSVADAFGDVGDVFVAETGAFVPVTGAAELEGYKVVRVNRTTGAVEDFVAHVAQEAPVIFNPSTMNKPIDVKFNNGAMLIVDFGVFEPGLNLQQAHTGKVWRVVRQGTVTLPPPSVCEGMMSGSD